MMLAAVRRLRGPNSYLPRPVLVARVHLGRLAGWTTAERPDLADRLLADLPGLAGQRCGERDAGSLAAWLRDGTGAGHVIEHVTRELSVRIGREVTAGLTVPVGESGCCDIVTDCPPDEPAHSIVGERLLRLALDLVGAYAAGQTAPALDDRLAEIAADFARESLGPSTAVVAAAAREHGIPVERVGGLDLLRLGSGRHRRLVGAAMTDGTSAVGVAVSHDRALTRRLLADLGLPVPLGGGAVTAQQAVDRFIALGSPVVVRPRHGPVGQGPLRALRTAAEVRQAYDDILAGGGRTDPGVLGGEVTDPGTLGGEVIVEGLPPGRDYRVLVVAGRVASATEWLPDGGAGRVEAGAGGAGRDVTGDVHPDVDELCRRVAAATGLDIAGIDLRLPGIAEPLSSGELLSPAGPDTAPTGVITGLAAGPDLCLTAAPGRSREASRGAGRAIVAALYPSGAPSRIPTVAVTGAAATATARFVSHLLAEGGRRVGLADTDGVYVADRPVARRPGGCSRAAQIVLGDPTVDVAVLVVDEVELREGDLGYDWTDMAVITGDDCSGASIVAERVCEGGTLVLHAGARAAELVTDPAVRAGHKSVVLFDIDPASPGVRQHLQAGGCAYVLDAGWLTQLRDCYKARVVPVEEVAGADGERAEHRVIAALAAVAAAAAHGLSPATIRRRLASLDTPESTGEAATVLRFDGDLVEPADSAAGTPAASRQAA